MRNIFVVKRRKDSSPEPRHGKHIKYVALRSGIECFTSLRYAKHSTPDPDLSSNILKPKTWKPKHSEKAIFRHPSFNPLYIGSSLKSTELSFDINSYGRFQSPLYRVKSEINLTMTLKLMCISFNPIYIGSSLK